MSLVNVRGKVYDTAQTIMQLSFKPTIDKTEIFVDIYRYIHINEILE